MIYKDFPDMKTNEIDNLFPTYMEGCHNKSQHEEEEVGVSKDSLYLICVFFSKSLKEKSKEL